MEKKIRVLIVDDSEATRDALEAALREKEDIEIAGCAENGLEALDALRAGEVDVMLLDMVMPKLDGFGVLSELKRQEAVHKPRIIAVTALVRDDFIQRAVSLGVAADVIHHELTEDGGRLQFSYTLDSGAENFISRNLVDITVEKLPEEHEE